MLSKGYCKDQIEALGCRGSSWGTLQLVGELMGTTYEYGAKGAIKGFTCTLDEGSLRGVLPDKLEP